MAAASDVVTEFLKGWKPVAEMPPGNAVRRGILRFMAAPDVAAREKLLEKTSELFALHRIYRELSIFREDDPPFAQELEDLLSLSVEAFAGAVKEGAIKPFAETLQKGFQFGRHAPNPKHIAMRRFLQHLFNQQVNGPSVKYTYYANGVIHGSPGKTHEEMANEFQSAGFGGDRPQFGGQFFRVDTLAFNFDTSSTTFVANVQPQAVVESVQRWVRLTGGQPDKIDVKYTGR